MAIGVPVEIGRSRSIRAPALSVDRGAVRALAAVLGLAVIALVPRVVDLPTNPPEYFEDELAGVVSAWSLVTTGQDVERTVLPFLETRLELKLPGFFAATIPFSAILGPDVLAARLPAVAFGIGTVGLVAWFALRIGRSAREATIAAFVLAVAPWSIHYSRIGWEPAAWLPVLLAGLGLLWSGLDRHRPARVIAGAALLAVGWYVYRPAMLVDVLLAGVVTLLFVRSIDRRDIAGLAIGGLVAGVILLPMAGAWGEPLLHHRTGQMFVFREGLTEATLARFVGGYLAQWEPAALLGDATTVARINPGRLLPVWVVPFLLVGVVTALRRHSRADLLVLSMLILGPLPAALAQDEVRLHAARGLATLPGIALAVGIGLATSLGALARVPWRRTAPSAVLLLGGVVALEAGLWAADYYGRYPTRSAGSWGFGGGAALELAGRTVPEGATLCIASPDTSAFTLPHRLRVYLPDRRFDVMEGLADRVCRRPGAFALVGADRWSESGDRTLVGEVDDPAGRPVYRLWRIEP